MSNRTDRAEKEAHTPPDDRRAFLGKLAAGAGTLALGSAALSIPDVLTAQATQQGAPDGAKWLANLKGKHKQMVDAYQPNEGFPLIFAHTFLVTQPANEPGGAVIVLRHMAMPLALNHAMWAKYKIGQNIKVDDPTTKKPALKNPFYKAPAGSLLLDDMAVDKLLAKGVTFGACNVALQVLSGMFAEGASMTKDAAAKEWAANLIPGITLIPSGTWGVNRAQEAGCTYCTGGG